MTGRSLHRRLPILIFLIVLSAGTTAQNLTQTVRGFIIDKESKGPLIGANVVIVNSDPFLGATTDLDGNFRLENVPVGRHTFQISYLGYEPMVLPDVLVTSGKEKVLTIELTESLTTLKEAEVTARQSKDEAINEMATVSARTFSVEETQRYAAAIFDPARMAQNFAGVASGGDDLSNEIVVRGNSPKGILWRLEGIEIPSPNHFDDVGNSGGAISMLSSSTLANSDFYTGAFPAEFGNALSGVFDLNFRNGNNQKREYAFMAGVTGIEASMEGPFSANSQASYLINYRYSTTALIKPFLESSIGDVVPTYSDLSFKVNVPTKKAGTFSLFGLGGVNEAAESYEADSSLWESDDDYENFSLDGRKGVIGLNHRILVTDKSYLKTVLSGSYNQYKDLSNTINNELYVDENNFQEEAFDETNLTDYSVRLSTFYNHKFNARHTLRTGAIINHLGYDFFYRFKDLETDIWSNNFNNKGNTWLLQAYGQWKFRLSDKWTLNSGFHAAQFTLNNTYSIEPRGALSWQANPIHRFSLAVGMHSKPEHLSTYFARQDGETQLRNRDLEFTKAWHYVLGHDFRVAENMRLKTEVYYQRLFNVPIENQAGSTFSLLNGTDVWDVVNSGPLVNEGTGENYGIDLTLERFFANNYYFLVTGSLFDSRFEAKDGNTYPTRYASNYLLTMLGGREFKVGREKQNIIGVNGKFIRNGGNRFSPIDLAASREAGETVIQAGRFNDGRVADYYRFDVGVSYKINRAKLTHSILFDIQNITNRQNVFSQSVNIETGQTEIDTQTGLLPVINYRIEF